MSEYILNNIDYDYETIYLNEDKTSYVIYIKNFLRDIDYDYNALWNRHPENYKTLNIYGRNVLLPRYIINCLRDYYFSGKLFKADPLPIEFDHIVKKIQTLFVNKDNNTLLNGCLINWYECFHYIGPHSDSENALISESPIVTLSLGETRIFRLVPKKNGLINYRKDIKVNNEDLLIMMGKSQLTHTHEIVKTKKKINSRISITMRCFT